MLGVIYDFTVDDEVDGQLDYASPCIAVVFNCNGMKTSFYPETLGESKKWGGTCRCC